MENLSEKTLVFMICWSTEMRDVAVTALGREIWQGRVDGYVAELSRRIKLEEAA